MKTQQHHRRERPPHFYTFPPEHTPETDKKEKRGFLFRFARARPPSNPRFLSFGFGFQHLLHRSPPNRFVKKSPYFLTSGPKNVYFY